MSPHDIDTSRQPFVLVWELTQACELACKHCRAEAQPRRHPDERTTDEGKELLDEARTFGENQLVVLSGDDALYRDDALDAVALPAGVDLCANYAARAGIPERLRSAERLASRIADGDG